MDAAELVAVLNKFAATVTGDFALDDILQQLALGALRVLQVDGAGVAAPTSGGGVLRTVFATGGAPNELERLQDVLQEGPCMDAHASGRVVNVANLDVEGSWPRYQERALELGVRAVAAIPLVARGQRWGVLDVYRADPLPLSAEELTAASTLANLAISYLVVARDRDAAREAQRELSQRAMNDALTGLPVRWVFLEHLDHALARLPRSAGQVAVLFIDIDGLKYVNDTYGHAAGDRLLVACADRIRAALRPSDVLARMGGDEFVVLIEEIERPSGLRTVAQRILDSLGAPYQPDGNVIRPSASIGIAATADPGTPGATLVAHADSAMYQAKRSQTGGIRHFDPTNYASGRADEAAHRQQAAELQRAIRGRELEVHYQPIFHIPPQPLGYDSPPVGSPPDGPVPGEGGGATRSEIYAVEALVRWRHPVRGLLTAATFLEVAERNGLLHQVGSFVVREAFRQFAMLREEFDGRAPRQLFINMSPAELLEPHLVERTFAAFSESGLDPQLVTVEVTETGLMHQGAEESGTLDRLRGLGCSIAIDDFGTGYSSLSRLIQIPAEVIKIDQSFTRSLTEATTEPDAAAVITAVRSLGTSLHRTVIAEGVETSDALHGLQALGITHFQGYHLASPMHPDALRQIVGGPAAG